MKAFSKFHPMVIMIYFLTILLVSMFSNNPVIGLLALLGGILFCITLTSRKEKRSDIMFYIPLFVLITVTNPLFSHNGATPLFFMNGNAITLEAVIYGGGIAVMIISVIIWCKSYSYVMTSDKFIFLFGRIIPKLSLVLSMALRYIPMLKRQAHKVNRAQKAMGLYTSDSWFNRVRSSLRVFSALIGWSLENAVETSNTMKARGYGLTGHSHYLNYQIHKGDVYIFLYILVSLSMTFVGFITGEITFSYYPKISNLLISPVSVISYTGFGLLAFLPFIIEVGESIRWSYYRSKI